MRIASSPDFNLGRPQANPIHVTVDGFGDDDRERHGLVIADLLRIGSLEAGDEAKHPRPLYALLA